MFKSKPKLLIKPTVAAIACALSFLPLSAYSMTNHNLHNEQIQRLIQQLLQGAPDWQVDTSFMHDSFSFNGSNDQNINEYQGANKTTNITAWHRIGQTWGLGISFKHTQGYLNLHTSLVGSTGGVPYTIDTANNQTMKGNVIDFKFKKLLSNGIFVESFTGFGRNNFKLDQKILNTSNTTTSIGDTRFSNDVWNIGAMAGFVYPLQSKLSVSANIATVYNRITQESYDTNFKVHNNVTTLADQLRSQSGFTASTWNFVENVGLGYKVTDKIQPFVGVGLLQIVHRTGPDSAVTSTADLPVFGTGSRGYNLLIGSLFPISKRVAITLGFNRLRIGDSFTDNAVNGNVTVNF